MPAPIASVPVHALMTLDSRTDFFGIIPVSWELPFNQHSLGQSVSGLLIDQSVDGQLYSKSFRGTAKPSLALPFTDWVVSDDPIGSTIVATGVHKHLPANVS